MHKIDIEVHDRLDRMAESATTGQFFHPEGVDATV